MSRPIETPALMELRRLQERIEQQARANAPGPDAQPDGLGLAFRPGARVLDQVTGEKGVVRAGRKTNIVLPSAGR